MADKTFIVRFKARELSTQLVIAANAEIHADHMVLLNSTGKLTALFLLELVESWTELPQVPPLRLRSGRDDSLSWN
jgi:hypothetical protein